MRSRTILTLALLLALPGCLQPQEEPPAGDDDANAPPAPPETSDICVARTEEPTGAGAGQIGVSNQRGSFSYAGQVAAKTGTETFVWENPSSVAQVMWGGQAGTGSVTLTLRDHCDNVVYEKEVGGAGQQGAAEMTREGEPGDWFVVLEFSLYTGQMGLQISSA